MIVSIAHKGLRLLWEDDDPTKLPKAQVEKIRFTLDLLDAMPDLEELRCIRKYRLHKLKGKLKEYWAITISGNDRMIFQYIDEDVHLVNYLDYH